MRAAKVQASLRIRAVSPEPPLLAHTSSESRGTFRQKARSLAPLNGWACAVEICHDGMLEDTNSLDAVHLLPAEKKKENQADWEVWKQLISGKQDIFGGLLETEYELRPINLRLSFRCLEHYVKNCVKRSKGLEWFNNHK